LNFKGETHAKVHTLSTVPDDSRAALEGLQKAFGFIPNIAGVIANSPTLIKSLACVFANVHSGSLSEAEIQILLLTNAVTNACTWAVAFHTTLALEVGADAKDVQAIRDGRSPKDSKSAELSSFAKALIEGRGHVSPQQLDSFLSAGFEKEQALEVIAVSAASTITNYAGTLTQPPLEGKFQQNSWTPKT
jgi:AhpD family alkylhydroperoxidase